MGKGKVGVPVSVFLYLRIVSLLLNIMYRQQPCNQRNIFSHDVEMNNKGILHFIF